MIPAVAALAAITLTAAILYRKKIVSAVFWLITGILTALYASFRYFTPPKRPAARHAVPRPPRDDGQDVARWLRGIQSPLRKRQVPPAAVARTRVAALRMAIASSPGPAGQLTSSPPVSALSAAGASTGPGVANPVVIPPPGVPAADVDMYLAEHAALWPAEFDRACPVLAGELAPLPWIGQPVGDIMFEPTLPPLPEPVRDWRPHACPDVDQPTATLVQPETCKRCLFDIREQDGRWLLAWWSPDDDTDPADCHGRPHEPMSIPQDVPGPADSAPSPAGSAEAAIPPAAAGPGTPDVDNLDDTGVMAALTDWALHAPLDQVQAASHG